MRRPGPIGSRSPICPLGALCCACSVLGHLAPVHRCACPVRCVLCKVSWATWLLFTFVPAPCIVFWVRCPGPLGSCLLVCPLRALCWVCGVLGHLAPVHQCACSARCLACEVSWATWLLFIGVLPWCVMLRVRCPGPLGSCSLVFPLSVLCCVCGVLGRLAPVHRGARPVCRAVCTVSWATWFLFTPVLARRVVLRAEWPWPLCSCSPVGWLGVLCCVCRARTRPWGRRLFVADRGWVPSTRALVYPDNSYFVAGRGWVRCRVRTRPSRRRLGGCVRGAFWCPTSFLLPLCFSFRPVQAVCALAVGSFSIFIFAPPSSLFVVSRFLAAPRCPLPPPLVFFLRSPLVSVSSFFLALGACGLGALWLPPPLLWFLFFLLPPLSPLFRCFWPWVPWRFVDA